MIERHARRQLLETLRPFAVIAEGLSEVDRDVLILRHHRNGGAGLYVRDVLEAAALYTELGGQPRSPDSGPFARLEETIALLQTHASDYALDGVAHV